MIASFVGSIPVPAALAVAKWVQHHAIGSVQVICSGGFRIEDVVRSLNPGVGIHGNDVTLVPCAAGRFLAGSDDAGLEFSGPWSPLDEARSRALALVAADAAGRAYRKRWSPSPANIAYVLQRVEQSHDRMKAARETLRLRGFSERDLRDCALDHPAEAVIGFPPTYKGGYERMYAGATGMVRWAAPHFEQFDPAGFPDLARQVAARGKPWLLGSDRHVAGLPLLAIHRRSAKRSIYIYGDPPFPTVNSSPSFASMQFPLPVEPARITADSRVELRPFLKTAHFDAVASAYNRVGGSMVVGDPIAVEIDGRFAGAGGFSYDVTLSGGRPDLVLAVDFAVSGARRLSKLIPMLFRSSDVKAFIERKRFRRYDHVVTQVLTQRPVSMKCRGTGFKLVRRKPGILSYRAPWSQQTSPEVFEQWYRRHAA